MNSSHSSVVYDACVLYPAPLRDLLMWLALSGMFRARWTHQIQEEWKHALLKHRPDLTKARLDRTSALMELAIPGALVTGYEGLVDGLVLPDPDDRHVLAAAIRCGASAIVTSNRQDFPPRDVMQFGIEAQHPDEFIADLIDRDPGAVVTAARNQRSQLMSPKLDVTRYLGVLRKQGLMQTCDFLETYRDIL